jgi:hypothetical protein
MKRAPAIAKSFLAGSQGAEIFYRPGDNLTVQSHYDPSDVLVAVLNVEVDLRGGASDMLRGRKDVVQDTYLVCDLSRGISRRLHLEAIGNGV